MAKSFHYRDIHKSYFTAMVDLYFSKFPFITNFTEKFIAGPNIIFGAAGKPSWK